MDCCIWLIEDEFSNWEPHSSTIGTASNKCDKCMIALDNVELSITINMVVSKWVISKAYLWSSHNHVQV